MNRIVLCLLATVALMSSCNATPLDEQKPGTGGGTGETWQGLPLNLFPEVPQPKTNPYWLNMYACVRLTTPLPDPMTRKEAEELLPAIYSYLHPQSARKGEKAIVERAVAIIDTFFHNWDEGKYKYGEMLFASQTAQAYYMLQQYSPDDIPKDKIEFWNMSITKQSEAVLKNTALYDDLQPGKCWLNGDIRLMLGLYFSGRILKNDTWTQKAETVIEKVVPQTILNGGGTRYVGYQSESPTYHNDSKEFTYRWYYMTGSLNAREFMRKMTPYAPMTVHMVGKGFCEYISSPSWKLYYNMVIPNYAASIAALMFYDQYNWTIGKSSTIWDLAFIYRNDVKGKELPDNYLVLDENQIGPRGRYGKWGYVGFGRNIEAPAPELSGNFPAEMDGKQAIVGAYLLNPNASPTEYPLNAVCQAVMPTIKAEQGVETEFGRVGNRTFDLVSNEKNTMILSQKISSMTSRYTISKSRFRPIDWSGTHQWIMTPSRIIGMVAVEAMVPTSAYGLFNRIKLVSGRKGVSGTRKELVSIDDKTFGYGELRVRFHEQNYGGDFSHFYYGTYNDKGDTYSCMLQLHDVLDKGNDAKVSYPKGHTKYALVEVVSSDVAHATNVQRIESGELRGFTMTEPDDKVTIVHNPTRTSQKFTRSFDSPKGNLFLAKSWEQNKVSTIALSSGRGDVTLDIPAYGHIIVVSANEYDPRVNRYNDIFK